jgi:hypothetical protein
VKDTVVEKPAQQEEKSIIQAFIRSLFINWKKRDMQVREIPEIIR